MKYTRKNIYRHLKISVTFSKKLMIIGGILTLLITAVSLISPYLYKILVDDVMTAGNIDLLYYVVPAMVGDVNNCKYYLANYTPLEDIAEFRDVANAAWFFSTDLSRNTTGAELTVDGGMLAQLTPNINRELWK